MLGIYSFYVDRKINQNKLGNLWVPITQGCAAINFDLGVQLVDKKSKALLIRSNNLCKPYLSKSIIVKPLQIQI